jgi:hypothetical protein
VRTVQKYFHAIYIVMFLLGLGLAATVHGSNGTIGFTIGTLGTASNIVALWMGVQIGTSAYSPKGMRVTDFLIRAMLALALFPGFFVAMRISHSLGSAADGCFIWGVALVYSVTILWGVLRTQLD